MYDSLTRWSALASFALYVVTLCVWRRGNHARVLWSAACALMLLHTALAFHLVHHWSHAAAYADTARQTNELLGIDWGGGLFFNYALLIVWLADVIHGWRGIERYKRRPRAITWLIHGFIAFMWFNATVVFGHGWGRLAGVAGFVILAIVSAKPRRV